MLPNSEKAGVLVSPIRHAFLRRRGSESMKKMRLWLLFQPLLGDVKLLWLG
jgi:hypothetical protein